MGDGSIIRNNFVTKVQWEGSYQGRRESSNFRYNGAFNLDKATNLVLQNNHVGGAERLGFRTTGEPCGVSSADSWTGNVAHTALVGVGLLTINPLPGWLELGQLVNLCELLQTALKNISLFVSYFPGYLKQCTMYSNFTVWKNFDYGIFYQGSASSSVRNLKAADNGVSVFQFVEGPPSLSHRFQDKYANVIDSLIIGTSDELNCSTAKGDRSDFNFIKSREKIKSHSFPLRVGVTMPTFTSGGNACPNMPCSGIMSYQTIKGIFRLQGRGFGSCNF